MSATATHDRESKPANKRGAARLAAVQALYQMEVSGSSLTEIVAEYENHRLGREVDGEQYLDADAGWFRSIVAGVVGRQRQIDPVIHAALTPDWPLARIEILLRGPMIASTRPGMPLEVTYTYKKEETMTMKVLELKPGPVDPKVFEITKESWGK